MFNSLPAKIGPSSFSFLENRMRNDRRPIAGFRGHFAKNLVSSGLSLVLLRNRARTTVFEAAKNSGACVPPLPLFLIRPPSSFPEIVYPFSCVPTRCRVVNDIMESRSTSPSLLLLLLSPPHVGPPRLPSFNVTSPTTLLFFSHSLIPPPPSPPRSPPLSFSPRHLCYPVFLLRSVKRAETSRRSFFFYRTFRRPLPSLLLLIPYPDLYPHQFLFSTRAWPE